MKTKSVKKEKLSVVEKLREIRDDLNLDIQDLSPEKLMEYLKKKKTLHNKLVWK